MFHVSVDVKGIEIRTGFIRHKNRKRRPAENLTRLGQESGKTS